MPIIKLGGPQKFSHMKKWASEFPALRTTDLERCYGCVYFSRMIQPIKYIFLLPFLIASINLKYSEELKNEMSYIVPGNFMNKLHCCYCV